MCVYKVIGLWILLIVPATVVHGVPSERDAPDAASNESATSQTVSALKIDCGTKQYLESIDQKLTEQEKRSEALLSAISQLNGNLTTLSTHFEFTLNEFQNTIDQKLSEQEKKLDGLQSIINKLNENFAPKIIEATESNNQNLPAVTEVAEVKTTAIPNLTTVQPKPDQTKQTVNATQEEVHTETPSPTSTPSPTTQTPRPVPLLSCKENPSKPSGKYRLQPLGFTGSFVGYCEQTTFGGGWLVFQYRFDGSVDFDRDWKAYRNGFGSLDGEFWLGLEHLYWMTSTQPYEVLFELKDFEGNYKYALYKEFEIDDEDKQYVIRSVRSYKGTAGDSFSLRGTRFSTKDRDNDEVGDKNCADLYHGAWWHKACTSSNLNGRYENSNDLRNMFWYGFNGNYTGLAYSRIMIRETGW